MIEIPGPPDLPLFSGALSLQLLYYRDHEFVAMGRFVCPLQNTISSNELKVEAFFPSCVDLACSIATEGFLIFSTSLDLLYTSLAPHRLKQL